MKITPREQIEREHAKRVAYSTAHVNVIEAISLKVDNGLSIAEALADQEVAALADACDAAAAQIGITWRENLDKQITAYKKQLERTSKKEDRQ